MKVILYDLGPEYGALIESKCDRALAAEGLLPLLDQTSGRVLHEG